MVAVGPWFELTVSTASALVVLPKSLETTARKRAPLSVVAAEPIVWSSEVAPLMFPPLRCH